MYPDSIKSLIESFKFLPGIGEKTAERLAFSVLDLDEEQVEFFADSIKDIKENMQVRTLGILSSMRIIKTKKDEDMAFAVLEDNMSSIELTLFPNVFNRYQDLRTGVIVIITGTVQMRSKLQIVVNDIQII